MQGIPAEIVPLLAEFQLRSACNVEVLAEVERQLGYSFPSEYRQFLSFSNGGEGLLGNESYLVLDPVEELVEYNDAQNLSESRPGLVLFGSDGGGTYFAFDMANPGKPVVAFDPVSASPEDQWFAGRNFWDFLKRLDQVVSGIDWNDRDD